MYKQMMKLLIIIVAVFGLTACSSNGFVDNEQQSNVEATEEKMLSISRGIINNICSIYTAHSEEEAEKILRKNIITEEVYYQGFLKFFKDSGRYQNVSVDLFNESVTNLNSNNGKTIGTIVYEFDITVRGINENGSEEVIGQEKDLVVQIAHYQGNFRMIEIRRK